MANVSQALDRSQGIVYDAEDLGKSLYVYRYEQLLLENDIDELSMEHSWLILRSL